MFPFTPELTLSPCIRSTPENLEEKVTGENAIYVTVEDSKNKMEQIKEKLKDVKEVKLIAENEDKTKKYIITANKDIDLRKNIFETFAKEEITIFEMKKADVTLEDAFMQLIETQNEENKKKEENKKDKEDKKIKEEKDNKSKTKKKGGNA